jgi:hypothetical protein
MALHMNMNSRLFAGKEEKTKTLFGENGGAHSCEVPFMCMV